MSLPVLAAIALSTGLAMGATLEIGWVQLKDRAVHREWLVLAAIAVAAVPIIVAGAQILGLSLQLVLLSAWIPALAMYIVMSAARLRYPRGVRTGDAYAGLFAGVNRAQAAFELGDLDGAEEALRAARSGADAKATSYIDLWLRLVDEERRRREGERISSQATRQAINFEFTRLLARRARPPAPTAAIALAVGVAFALGIGIASGRAPATGNACADAEPVLARAEAAPRTTSLTDRALEHLTLTDPGEPAQIVIDSGSDLEGAAESRHDPSARDKLQADGFVHGYTRQWATAAGPAVSAEIFQFETPAGAARFHREMTEYACRFANAAFAGPNRETGLQVRYSTGDPIVEQLAWVDGSLRLVVSHGFPEPPPDHGVIIHLAGLAAARLPAPR